VHPTLMASIHQPLDAVDNTGGGARNPAFAKRLASGLGLPLKPLVCWSVCHGSMTDWITNHQSGSAITVEFPANVSGSWLTGGASRAIIAAFGGTYLNPATHNPRLIVDSMTAVGTTVTARGWAFDPDNIGYSLSIPIYEGHTLVGYTVARGARPDVNRVFHLVGNHGFSASFIARPGTHSYCVYAINIGYGNGNTAVCHTVTVR